VHRLTTNDDRSGVRSMDASEKLYAGALSSTILPKKRKNLSRSQFYCDI